MATLKFPLFRIKELRCGSKCLRSENFQFKHFKVICVAMSTTEACLSEQLQYWRSFIRHSFCFYFRKTVTSYALSPS